MHVNKLKKEQLKIALLYNISVFHNQIDQWNGCVKF